MQDEDNESERRCDWSGWVGGATIDRAHLESLGVTVVQERARDAHGYVGFEVRMGPDAVDRLDPFWGRYVWGLFPCSTSEPSR